jgi:hypothetical protein
LTTTIEPAGETAPEPRKPKKTAKFQPNPSVLTMHRAFRLYDDGTLRSPWGSGSVRGAHAQVEEAGNRRVIRDFRTATLMIEGPELAIALPLRMRHNKYVVRRARRFAVEVNRAAARLAQAQP